VRRRHSMRRLGGALEGKVKMRDGGAMAGCEEASRTGRAVMLGERWKVL
jgi:hypothetical protein